VKRRWFFALASLVALGCLFLPGTVRANTAPDVLAHYTIAITPQADGTLVMDYTLDGYRAGSDWPSNEPYLQIGVPNGSFSITDWGSNGTANVSGVEPVDSNGSFVQFNFASLPRTGDVFGLHFTISQGQMANPDTSNSLVTFNFIPAGWTFPITVNELTVTWANPSTPSLLKSVQPAPGQGSNVMTWNWRSPAIDSSGMFSSNAVELAYDSSAFALSDAAIAQTGSNNGPSGGLGGYIIVLFLIAGLIALANKLMAGDSYEGGAGIRPGQAGYMGYRGGCACACAGCACACACACAGGGKVGCSRKAIGIACLPNAIRTMSEEGRLA
jgi:hypothetical protein